LRSNVLKVFGKFCEDKPRVRKSTNILTTNAAAAAAVLRKVANPSVVLAGVSE